MSITKNKINKRAGEISGEIKSKRNYRIRKAERITTPHPTNSKSTLVFWYINYGAQNRFAFYLINIACISGFIFGVFNSYPNIQVISVLALFCAWIFIIIQFIRKRNWYEKLPFNLIGWPEVVNHNSIGGSLNKSRVWRNCTIELVNAKGAQLTAEEIELRANIFLIFITSANNLFYGCPSTSNNNRVYWQYKKNIAKGSLNSSIIKELKDFIEGELNFLHHEFKTLTAVKITVDQHEFYVDETHDGSNWSDFLSGGDADTHSIYESEF